MGVGVPNDDYGTTYFHRLLESDDSNGLNLTTEGINILVDNVRTLCFSGSIERFIGALVHYQQEIKDPPAPSSQEVLNAAWKLAICHLDDAERSADKLRLCCVIIQEGNIEITGKVRGLIRQYVREIGHGESDRFAREMHNPTRREVIRDIIAGALFDLIGPWRIWCSVRRFFLKRLDLKKVNLEEDMGQDREIERLRNTLLGSWMHKIVLGPAGQEIMEKEAELTSELIRIDDEGGEWITGNIPAWRRGDNS
ncbi:MAG: hypothetical protein M1324_04580 [Patescibacteria group bacterium]|nr:hypothetical protein [Patescibacteria group bacterium]